MRFKIVLRTAHWLLMAGFAVGTVAAQAASGITITQNDETRIAVGR
jgi:hypothetical protein